MVCITTSLLTGCLLLNATEPFDVRESFGPTDSDSLILLGVGPHLYMDFARWDPVGDQMAASCFRYDRFDAPSNAPAGLDSTSYVLVRAPAATYASSVVRYAAEHLFSAEGVYSGEGVHFTTVPGRVNYVGTFVRMDVPVLPERSIDAIRHNRRIFQIDVRQDAEAAQQALARYPQVTAPLHRVELAQGKAVLRLMCAP